MVMKIYNYIKYLLFYGILLVESLLNFLASVLGCYPTFDWSTAFLARLELFRVGNIVSRRNNERDNLLKEASDKYSEAKESENE